MKGLFKITTGIAVSAFGAGYYVGAMLNQLPDFTPLWAIYGVGNLAVCIWLIGLKRKEDEIRK